MTAMDLVKPWRVIGGIVPVLYAGVVIMALPQSRTWLVLVCGIVVAASIVASWLEYPLLALWPTFGGMFLLSVCTIALIINVPNYHIAPMTGSSIEIPIAAVVACGFMLWGIYTSRKMLTY